MFITATLASCWGDDFEFDYDPNAVVPKVQNMAGPTEAISNGFGENTYTCAPRSGSSFAWTVTGTGATITNPEPYTAVVVFSETSENGTAIVSVVETASNGKSSEAAEIEVALSGYCPLNAGAFVGTIVTSDDDCGYTTSGVISLGSGANDLVIDGIMDAQVQDSWGEVYDAGVGNDGNVHITLNEDGTAVIPSQHMGTTDNGSWEYWIRGEGSYSQCDKIITLNYIFGDSADDYYECKVIINM